MFTDIDCLTYEIEREDVRDNLHKNWKKIDVSNYPKNLDFCNKANKIIISEVNNEA